MPRKKKKDLALLIATYGPEQVAQGMGVSTRALVDYRAGIRALNVDHLLRLGEAFADFDADATISRLGVSRREKGRDRRRQG